MSQSMPEKWSHCSASPGGYVYDPEMGRCPGRINKDGTEDKRFTADGDASVMNGFFSVFSYPHTDPLNFMESVESGYIFQGYGVILSEWAVLTGPQWAAKFAELSELYPQSLKELLWEVNNHPEAERRAKLEVVVRLYGSAAKDLGLSTEGYRAWEKERKAEAKAVNDEKLIERIQKQIEVALGKYRLGHKRVNRSGVVYYLEASWPKGVTLANVDPYTALYGWRADFSPKTGMNALIFDKAFHVAWGRYTGGRKLVNFNRTLRAYFNRLPQLQKSRSEALKDVYRLDPVIMKEEETTRKLRHTDTKIPKKLKSLIEEFCIWRNGHSCRAEGKPPEWIGTWKEFVAEEQLFLPTCLRRDDFLTDFIHIEDDVLDYFSKLNARVTRLENRILKAAAELPDWELFRLFMIQSNFRWTSDYWKHGARLDEVPLEVDAYWKETRGLSFTDQKAIVSWKDHYDCELFMGVDSDYFNLDRLGAALTMAALLGLDVGPLGDTFQSLISLNETVQS